jgi:hypothetical protein
MNGRLVLAALVGLLFTPTVWAQTNCEPYEKLVAALPTNFASLKGKEVYPGSAAVFMATLSLGGECEVWSADNSYSCRQVFKTEAEARAAASAQLAKAKPCFPGWTTRTLIDPPSASPGNRDTLALAGFMLPQGDKGALFTVSLQRQRFVDRDSKREWFEFDVMQRLVMVALR